MRTIEVESQVRRLTPSGPVVDQAASDYTFGWRRWVRGESCPASVDGRRGWNDAKYAADNGRNVRWSR